MEKASDVQASISFRRAAEAVDLPSSVSQEYYVKYPMDTSVCQRTRFNLCRVGVRMIFGLDTDSRFSFFLALRLI